MKKILMFWLVLVIGIFAAAPVCAINNEFSNNTSVEDYLPQEAKDILMENNIDSFDYKTLMELDVRDFIKYLTKCVENELTRPFTIIYVIFLVIIIIALVSGINGGILGEQLEKNFSVVGVLCVSSALSAPIIMCLEQSRQFIEKTTDFIRVFVPSFAAVMFASGHNNTAIGYQTTMIVAVEFVSSFLLNTVISLLYLFIAFSIVCKVAGEWSLDIITKPLRSIVLWSLSLVVSVFVALITIKGIIGVSSDSITLRTGKFFVGSFVPAVGAALSEATSTLQKSVGLIRNSTGIFGIITVFLYFIPPIIKILVYKLCFNVSATVSKMLGVNSVSELLSDIADVLNLIFSVILSYAALLILSTAVILSIGGTV